MSIDAGNGEHRQGVFNFLKALKPSHTPALGSTPCVMPPTETAEHAPTSGYNSVTSTTDPKVTTSDRECQLYGLTTSHTIRDHQIIPFEDDTSMGPLDGDCPVKLHDSDERMEH